MSSFIILVIQIWLLGIIALGLHRLSPQWGLTPIFFYVAGMIAVLNFAELLALYIEPAEGIILRTGGHVFVPVTLMIVLLLYIADGTRPAQITIYGITGINLFVLLTLFFLMLYMNVQSQGTVISGLLVDLPTNPINGVFVRGVAASLIAFVINMYAIIIVYQGTRNAFSELPTWIAPSVALIGALWVDTIVFNLIFFGGTSLFSTSIANDVLIKTLAAIILAIPTSYYLTRIAPNLPDYVGNVNRGTWDITRGTVGRLQQTLKELQSQLRVSRATYEQLTQNIEEVFWLADVDSVRVIYISPAFETITGYDPDDFIEGKHFLIDIVHPEDRREDDKSLLTLLRRLENEPFRVQMKQGGIRWVRNRLFPIYDDTGKLYRFAGIAEDITDKKHAEEQAVALTVAHEKMRVLHDFIRDASHDLKTPISAMLLKVDILNMTRDDAKRRQLGNELKERVNYLANMIDDLFTLSRIEGQEAVTLEYLDINLIVHEVAQSAQPLAEAKQLVFTTNVHDKPLSTLANYDQMTRVVTNLVGNAVRYTERGSVRVTTGKDDSQIWIRVQDTGMGIPADELPLVFNRFYRTESAKESDIQGTGLGLAICKAIVERHGGNITVDSTLNVGTRFTVTMPYVTLPTRSTPYIEPDTRPPKNETEST